MENKNQFVLFSPTQKQPGIQAENSQFILKIYRYIIFLYKEKENFNAKLLLNAYLFKQKKFDFYNLTYNFYINNQRLKHYF